MSFEKSQDERTLWLITATAKNERAGQIIRRVAECDDAADRSEKYDEERIYLRGMAEGFREAFGIVSR